MTEDELKAIEARAARKYESDAEEDVIALVAEVRRLRAEADETVRTRMLAATPYTDALEDAASGNTATFLDALRSPKK